MYPPSPNCKRFIVFLAIEASIAFIYAARPGHVLYDGKPITFKDGRAFAIRGIDDLTSIPVKGTSGVIEVVLEDFNGNKSEPVQVPFGTMLTNE